MTEAAVTEITGITADDVAALRSADSVAFHHYQGAASIRAYLRGTGGAIAEHWNVSKPTASRWRRRARELGYLDPYQPPSPPEPVEHPVYHHVALTRQLELQLFHKVLNNLDDYPGAVRWELEAEVFGRMLYQLAGNTEHPLHGPLHEQARALARALREHFSDDPE